MDQDSHCYTIITFAPIQAFIEKSRKLRDLYGSSYILSLLSWIICQSAQKQGHHVVSPALPNITQGMPNQIVLQGKLSVGDLQEIQHAFNQAWKCLVDSCREWIEQHVEAEDYRWWQRDWQLWANHCWEFFAAPGEAGESITQVRQRLNQVKHARNWTGINWQGESSTLTGTDAIAYPGLGRKADPRDYDYRQERKEVRAFYQRLSQKLGESFIDPREELSIPELIKRLITHEAIVKDLVNRLRELKLAPSQDEKSQIDDFSQISQELNPASFRDLNRRNDDDSEEEYWTGWFLGDGDSAGKYLQSLKEFGPEKEAEKLTKFSKEMREWGRDLRRNERQRLPGTGRMIYAGGDDFLGVLYHSNKQISPRQCLNWFYTFKSAIWHQPQPKKITPSVGFVWAGPQVPQRDVLQHCNLAEKSAKKTGRDRIAFRILFNSGNHLEWVCPWWLLDRSELAKTIPSLPDPSQNLIESYQDRNQGDNWTHFYQDVALLESRHVFNNEQVDTALALIDIYFGSHWRNILADEQNWWNRNNEYELQTFAGILGSSNRFHSNYEEDLQMGELEAFNHWVINLAKVGFYLTVDDESKIKPPVQAANRY